MSDRALRRLLVAAAAVAAMAPALTAGFVGWDEPAFIVDNPLIRGLGPAHLRAMLTTPLGGVWTPLTWLSLAADRAAWGPEPGGFHLTSVLLHAAAALLAFEVFRRLLKSDDAAALGALFFAVHPLNVETVAWAAERKGVLSGALVLASLLARLERREAFALVAYALALAAKPNVLTYPLALAALESLHLKKRATLRSYAPYFALSAAAFAATMLALGHTDAGGAAPAGVLSAAGQALYGLVFYPWKALWPSGLSAYYPPRPWFGSWGLPLWGCAAAVAAAAWAVRRRPALAAPAACYVLLALPTLGLVRHGIPHAAADRFFYLPGLAFAALFGAALARRRALAAVWLAALAAASFVRARDWRGPLELWTSAAAAEPSALADGNLGAFLVKAGRVEEGLVRLRAAAAADPSSPLAAEALGAALSNAGREAEARAAWRAAPRRTPEIDALLGASLARDPKTAAEGVELLRGAVASRPERSAWRANLADALVNLGNGVARRGRLKEAAALYREALAANPGSYEARANLREVTR